MRVGGLCEYADRVAQQADVREGRSRERLVAYARALLSLRGGTVSTAKAIRSHAAVLCQVEYGEDGDRFLRDAPFDVQRLLTAAAVLAGNGTVAPRAWLLEEFVFQKVTPRAEGTLPASAGVRPRAHHREPDCDDPSHPVRRALMLLEDVGTDTPLRNLTLSEEAAGWDLPALGARLVRERINAGITGLDPPPVVSALYDLSQTLIHE